MGRIQSVKSLPKPIFEELKERLIESNFSNYREHSEWLESQGFSISKSAVHNYATECKARLVAEQGAENGEIIDVRLQCLAFAIRIAEKNGKSNFTSQEVIHEANNLLKWVYTG